ILLALVANLINVALDRAFIFGVEGVVPEMGIKGAAIATCTGYLVQAFILLLLFLKKNNKEIYGTNHWKIHKTLFFKSLKVGAPQGIFYGLEIVGWAVFFEMMSKVSFLHITVSSICQSIIILLSFFMDGLTRGVASIAGNFIGAKKYDLISKVFRAGITLQIGFSLILALLLTLDPKVTLSVFFPVTNAEFLAIQDGFSEALQVSLIFVFFYITFEGFRWVISGLLSAAGDTLFLLIAGAGSVWVFLLLPVYLIVVRYSQPIEWAWAAAFFYSVITYAIYYIRYVKGKWKSIVLIEDSQIED
ncbi:MAG: MATE family efflux transporter, partial [Chlamydiota bacterium]